MKITEKQLIEARNNEKNSIRESISSFNEKTMKIIEKCMNENGLSKVEIEKLLMKLKKEELYELHGDLVSWDGLDEMTKADFVSELIDVAFFYFCDEYVDDVESKIEEESNLESVIGVTKTPEIRKEIFKMKNNKFFKALGNDSENMVTLGTNKAYGAWLNGCQRGLDYPFLADTVWEKDIADFFDAITKAGFKKFAYKSHSTMSFENIISFMKLGWEITGRLEIDDGDFDNPTRIIDCLIFERRR